MKYILVFLGIIIGEMSLVLFTTLAQEVVFDGISFTSSDRITLIAGGLLTFIAAMLAGICARYAGRTYSKIIPAVISILIILETTYLISSGISDGPLWFSALAGLSLILGVWLGYDLPKKQDSLLGGNRDFF